MTDKVVGDGDLTLIKVVNVMEDSPVFEKIYDKWRELIMKLTCSNDLEKRISNKISPEGSYWTKSIILDILTDWRSNCSQNAKIGVLINALESINLVDISELLKKKFLQNSDENDGEMKIVKDDGRARKEHMEYYLVDLLEATELSPDLVKDMVKNGVLSDDEATSVGRMHNQEDKNRMFYQFVLDKVDKSPQIFDAMTKAFQDCKNLNYKNEVINLLNLFYDDKEDKDKTDNETEKDLPTSEIS